MLHISVETVNDPLLARIGWAAARRGDCFIIAIPTGLSRKDRAWAVLEALTDAEVELLPAGPIAGPAVSASAS